MAAWDIRAMSSPRVKSPEAFFQFEESSSSIEGIAYSYMLFDLANY